MTIYLYVKTHNKTGLKYLGQTTSTDPHKYSGSGVYWLRHLKKNGYDYTTTILKECQHPAMIRFWGEYYSNLWNIVESEEWANLKEEAGAYGRHGSETRAKISAAQLGKKRGPRPYDQRILIAERNRAKAKDPAFRARLSAALKGHLVSDDTRTKLAEQNRAKAKDPAWIAKQRENSLANGSQPPSQKGIPWWTDGFSNKKQIESPGPNWRMGMVKKLTKYS